MAAVIFDNFKLDSNRSIDKRVSPETESELFSYPETALYEGIIAAVINGNNQGKAYQWFSANDDIKTYHKWRELETTKAADLFVIRKNKLSQPIPGKEGCIYLFPHIVNGSQATGTGSNALPVWDQFLWNTETNDWELVGSVNLNINADDFATKDDLTGFVTWDQYNTDKTQNEQDHQAIRDEIGQFQDFVNGFNNNLDGGENNSFYDTNNWGVTVTENLPSGGGN